MLQSGGGVTEALWRWDQQISPTVVIKRPAEGSNLAAARVRAREKKKRKRKKRGVPQTIENNTQRAFNDFILMLRKWLNLSEDTQQELCCGEKRIDSKHAI